jgi:hypothetical protein
MRVSVDTRVHPNHYALAHTELHSDGIDSLRFNRSVNHDASNPCGYCAVELGWRLVVPLEFNPGGISSAGKRNG